MPKSVKEMQESNPRARSEVARQFDEIFEEHHDPERREGKRLKDNRDKRAIRISEDAGL